MNSVQGQSQTPWTAKTKRHENINVVTDMKKITALPWLRGAWLLSAQPTPRNRTLCVVMSVPPGLEPTMSVQRVPVLSHDRRGG